MSYAKLHAVVSDFAVGLQSVNQAIDNNAAIFSQFNARHGTEYLPSTFQQAGFHDDLLIARTVIRCTIDTTGVEPRLVTQLNGPLFPSAVGDAIRIGVGRWRLRLRVTNLYAAVPMLESATATDRLVNCLLEGVGTAAPTIQVSTWNVAAAARADYAFMIGIWAVA